MAKRSFRSEFDASLPNLLERAKSDRIGKRRPDSPCRPVREPGDADYSPPVMDTTLRAAEYVRMSTDHQECSIECQRDAIAAYAKDHGLTVVRQYSDEARSGLDVAGRPGLRSLLADVLAGNTDFRTILVYDVSRWGRFQDTDESACYEFLCRRAGVRIEYCMEPFRNDGTAMAAVVKGLKRVMAGEYSRELSEKVFAGKCKLLERGFIAGGAAPFGLRRLVVDQAGSPLRVLERGEHKYLQTDRIKMIPGPQHEQEIVRWIFEEIAYRQGQFDVIARELNRQGIPSPGVRPWTGDRVRCIVKNEKYIGHIVYNRTNMRLKQPVRRNPRDQWRRADNVIEPIISKTLFDDAQRAMSRWATQITNQDALALLKALYKRHGKLSATLINSTTGMPETHFYHYRFGGLVRAYAMVGFVPNRDYGFLRGLRARANKAIELRAEVRRLLEQRDAWALAESKTVYRIQGWFRVAILHGWCAHPESARVWISQVHTRPYPDLVLIARFAVDALSFFDYWLVRRGGCVYKMREDASQSEDRIRYATLEAAVDELVRRAGKRADR